MKTISISQWVAAAVNPLVRAVSWGAHAPSRVAEDALVPGPERHDLERRTLFREGAKNSHARTRVLPVQVTFASLLVTLVAMFSAHAQVTRTIGILPPGGTVTITFDATINQPFSEVFCRTESLCGNLGRAI